MDVEALRESESVSECSLVSLVVEDMVVDAVLRAVLDPLAVELQPVPEMSKDLELVLLDVGVPLVDVKDWLNVAVDVREIDSVAEAESEIDTI